jgi:hypothetical protein
MSALRKPVPLSRDPSGWITDGQETVGLLFDGPGGTVATLSDRLPLGIFKDRKEARSAIHEARRDALADVKASLPRDWQHIAGPVAAVLDNLLAQRPGRAA